MARPYKCRRVCGLPRCTAFRPEVPTDEEPVLLSVDEYETIRWMDKEGVDQEGCAVRMQVSRATVQAIYDRARRKIAEALVEGRIISINGGDYRLCHGGECRHCCQKNVKEKGIMKRIAVCYENGEVFQHFGRTEQFKLYDVADGKVTDSKVISCGDYSHEGLAELLVKEGADTLVAGGMGAGARAALGSVGITIYAGAAGSADAAVDALLSGKLQSNPDATCAHHEEHGEGECPHHHGQ